MVPVPGRDAEKFSSALPWFPVVGLAIGGLFYGLVRGLSLAGVAWPEGEAAFIVGAGALLTRSIHLDGFADWADGFFGGGRDRERVLAIMKDPCTGAFGAVALVTVLLANWTALAQLIRLGRPEWIIAAFIVSRTMQVELATVLPYARANGTAAPFVKGARPVHRLIAMALAIIAMCLLFGPIRGLAVLFGGWLIARIFGWWCRRRVGGITGDLLGACSVLVETAVLFGAAGGVG